MGLIGGGELIKSPAFAIGDNTKNIDGNFLGLIPDLAGFHFDEALGEALLKIVFFGFNDAEAGGIEVIFLGGNEIVYITVGGGGFEFGSFPNFKVLNIFEGFFAEGINE